MINLFDDLPARAPEEIVTRIVAPLAGQAAAPGREMSEAAN